MIKKELSLDEINKLLFENRSIGQGTYGIVTKYEEGTLLKIYYKDIIETYLSRDISKLDKEIENKIEIEQFMKEIRPEKRTKLEEMTSNIDQLRKTKSSSLIKGVATYRGYLIGVFVEEYKGYELLEKIFAKLNEEERNKVLDNASTCLGDLYRNGIIPRDIKEDNIMVRKEDLDIKLIDLDDSETRYENEEYLEEFPHIKKDAIKAFENMKKRLEDIIEQIEGIDR